MDEPAHVHVARPAEPELAGVVGKPATDLGDRKALVVEPRDGVEQIDRIAGSGRGDAASVPGKVSRRNHESVATVS